MKFNEMKYERPKLEDIKEKYESFKEKMKNASNGKELIDTIKEFSKFEKEIGTLYTLVSVRHSIDTRDEFYKEENDYWDEISPVMSNYYSEIAKVILNSKYKDEVEKEIGKHYLDLLECSLVIEEKAIPYLQKENSLITKYDNLIANSEIEFEGKTYTLTQMGPLLQDTNRERRKAAYKARWDFFKENMETIDNIYDEMVKVRHEMAKELGYKDYVEFRYKQLSRTDYTREEVKRYREKILKNITPLVVELNKIQKEELGIEDFKFYDKPIEFTEGTPRPMGDKDYIVGKAKHMYEELSKETGEFFNFMISNDLMDLNAQPGKMGGGYCTSFDAYKSPFIFANFNGTKGDVEVVTHEAGHAFQNYMSQDKEIVEYIWPTYESCEIHSMSMEFLTWPWMKDFFENEDKFKFAHLKGAISFLPYGVTIDHFQHWVYENPTATPEERRNKFHEIEMIYQPDLDYDNEFLEKGGYWFTQSHVFSAPFYYIDYTLAQVLAFEYLIKSLEDPKKTLDEYITLCKAGGEESFFNLIEIGKLKNPMTTDVLDEIKPKLENILKELKEKIS